MVRTMVVSRATRSAFTGSPYSLDSQESTGHLDVRHLPLPQARRIDERTQTLCSALLHSRGDTTVCRSERTGSHKDGRPTP
ncbi:MAG: hypothetical protein CL927_12190 [Deltaproteobacteria bacterium]|nr:hypothetical protein [Deltaproteobacteria bacterium]